MGGVGVRMIRELMIQTSQAGAIEEASWCGGPNHREHRKRWEILEDQHLCWFVGRSDETPPRKPGTAIRGCANALGEQYGN